MADGGSRRVSDSVLADEVRARALSLALDDDASSALAKGGLGGRGHIAFTAVFWIPAPVFTRVTFFRGNDGGGEKPPPSRRALDNPLRRQPRQVVFGQTQLAAVYAGVVFA